MKLFSFILLLLFFGIFSFCKNDGNSSKGAIDTLSIYLLSQPPSFGPNYCPEPKSIIDRDVAKSLDLIQGEKFYFDLSRRLDRRSIDSDFYNITLNKDSLAEITFKQRDCSSTGEFNVSPDTSLSTDIFNYYKVYATGGPGREGDGFSLELISGNGSIQLTHKKE